MIGSSSLVGARTCLITIATGPSDSKRSVNCVIADSGIVAPCAQGARIALVFSLICSEEVTKRESRRTRNAGHAANNRSDHIDGQPRCPYRIGGLIRYVSWQWAGSLDRKSVV